MVTSPALVAPVKIGMDVVVVDMIALFVKNVAINILQIWVIIQKTTKYKGK